MHSTNSVWVFSRFHCVRLWWHKNKKLYHPTIEEVCQDYSAFCGKGRKDMAKNTYKKMRAALGSSAGFSGVK